MKKENIQPNCVLGVDSFKYVQAILNALNRQYCGRLHLELFPYCHYSPPDAARKYYEHPRQRGIRR